MSEQGGPSRDKGGSIPLVEKAGVDTTDRRQRCRDVTDEVGRLGLHTVRLAFADLHGLLRGKAIRADLLGQAFDNGLGITSALLMKDTGQNNVYPVWETGGGLGKPWMTGAGDVMMLPDPSTFRILPWVDGTGWLLCDLFSPQGEEVEFATRTIGRRAISRLSDNGLGFRSGLEVEFHLYRRPDPLAKPVDSHPGWVYLSEQRFDMIEPFLDLLRQNLDALGLPPRTLEIELGPSQAELTFSPADGLETADHAVLLRAAVKQIAARNGLHASFMSRPHMPNAFASGWHLHQSIIDHATGKNVFVAGAGHLLSDRGRHYLAGLLEHAAESCLLTTPTVTGYKRYRPDSLAPFRAAWASQHRGAMLRVVGGSGDPATRIENRAGDPAANPYLYVTSQVLSGLAGLKSVREPQPETTDPYHEPSGQLLPATLGEAVDRFAESALYRSDLGDEFVDYLTGIKKAEWGRFLGAVTDWEQNEYFELF